MHDPADRIDSWKEIAAYLKRGVRTAKRWEREEGLPVHRQQHKVLGSVFAYKSEIDVWRQGASRGDAPRTAATAEPVKTIAVLPFSNVSRDPENEYFADGLTAEVTADLSRVRSLRVISQTSAMRLKNTTKDVKTIARELGVRYLLEGSVRREANRLRVTAQLVDAGVDAQLWAGKYDGTVEDVFAIQERIAGMIVDALELRLTTDERQRLAERPIADLRAWECYLRARQEGWRWRKDAIDRAVTLLREALAITGDNAALHAALGMAWLQYREAGIDFSETPLLQAEECARAVLAGEPGSASGFQLRGWIHYSRGRIQDAVRDLGAALSIDGNDPDTLLLLSNCYLISGRVAQARALISRLVSIDPLTPLTRCMPAFADVMEGNLAAAVGPYRQMFELDPGNPMARLFYAWVLALNGLVTEAGQIVDAFSPDVRDTVAARVAVFFVRSLAGRAVEAQAALTNELEAATSVSDVFPRFLAEGYAAAGNVDRAAYWLTIAIDRGFINYPFLSRHDPFLKPLRGHPEFQGLLERVREKWERFEA